MLQPPGSRGPRTPAVSSRRKAVEVPDDVIRQLQRLGPNKRCADCTSKLPGCVNLTVGSFVCMTCAGIHRECNQKIKGVGHSSFTPEDAEQMKNTDNDKVNQLYLARYNPATERLRAPQGNHDQNHLRAWIKAKYVEKVWAGPTGQQQQPSAGTLAQLSPGQRHQQYGQPTVVQLPKEPEVDLFGSGNYSNALNPALSGNQGWDAFGGSQQQQQQHQQPPAFQANFANFDAPPQQNQPQQSYSQQQNDAFPADFGSSQVRQQLQHPTQQQQIQQQPIQQQQPTLHQHIQQQPAFQANFASFDQQQQTHETQQHGFANYNDQQPQQQQMQPHTQQQQQPSNFANSNQEPTPIQQRQTQGNVVNSDQQQTQQPHGFANVSHQTTSPTQVQPSSHHHPPGSFANFTQPPASLTQQLQSHVASSHHPQQNQPPQNSVSQDSNQFQGYHAQRLQLSESQGNQQQLGSFAAFQSQPMVPVASGQLQHVGASTNGESTHQPMSSTQQQHSASTAMTPAERGSSDLETHAVDHFASLADLTPTKAKPSSTAEIVTAKEKVSVTHKPVAGASKYKSGQRVYYTSSSFVGMVTIVKVHVDDELEPFYTIAVDGKERQTDNEHLAEKSPTQIEIEAILLELTDKQLEDVLIYTNRLKNGSHGLTDSVSQSASHRSDGPSISSSISEGQQAQLQSAQYASQMAPNKLSTVHGQPDIASRSALPHAHGQLSMTVQHHHQQPALAAQQQHQLHNMIVRGPPYTSSPPQNQQEQRTGGFVGNAPFGGIPSPSGLASPTADQSLNAFQGATSILPGPPLATHPQMHPQLQHGFTETPGAVQIPQQQDSSSQGGNPFDIY
ncbi:hypothetical protein MPSEU_000249100 [Mayamaea pseudoterrestris]|nr:hypothetical protein MPSEU_000249100 [Mayamaea pseudoterrestris]